MKHALRPLLALTVLAVAAAKVRAQHMKVVHDNAGISAQMMFLGADDKVYMLDKAENNTAQIDGHPAWATRYDTSTNEYDVMDVRANPFCAGGSAMGDGRWIVTGGNKAVGYHGDAVQQGQGPYEDDDGGHAIRFLHPTSVTGAAQAPTWSQSSRSMDKERWYPTVETLGDGSVVILGGMRDGGYVPSQQSNEPSYEFYPSRNGGKAVYMDFLKRTVPLSLYPLTTVLSNGQLLLQAGYETILYDLNTQKESPLPNASVPRVYPASGAMALLPLTPENDYKETVLFCGGMELEDMTQWGNEAGVNTSITTTDASKNCEQISPLDKHAKWQQMDSLPSGRSMGQLILLPDGKIWFGNGVTKGTAGYNTDPNSIGKPVGQSYGDAPERNVHVYDPQGNDGKRFRHAGRLTTGRMYHSSATLLADGSVLVGGSNPNADESSDHWATVRSVERWYPSWWSKTRPTYKGRLPGRYAHGKGGFNLTFSSETQASKAEVKLIRTGFSTHGMNMGQRALTLNATTEGSSLMVDPLPSNTNLFPPGPALAFVVVDGLPSFGKHVMVGSGSTSHTQSKSKGRKSQGTTVHPIHNSRRQRQTWK